MSHIFISHKLTYLPLVFAIFCLCGGQELTTKERHRSLRAEVSQNIKKDQIQISQQETKLEIDKLNILTLGGSVTWGAAIPDQDKSYPSILRNYDKHNVTNLAIRATGSDYPAQCIGSMLSDAESDSLDTHHQEIPFDVIIFEFSINGMKGFELLFKRLQERFPDALLIYIDLWSLKFGSMDSTNARQLVNDAGGYVYFLGNKSHPTNHFDYKNLEYDLSKNKLPSADIMELFASDTHHISTYGHRLVRYQIRNIIEQYGQFSKSPSLGSWHGGDKCLNWFEDGKASLRIIDGGTMNNFDKKNQKYAIEMDDSRMVFEYIHSGENEAPIGFQVMKKSEDMWDPFSSYYPPVVVRIAQVLAEINDAEENVTNLNVELDGENHPDLKISKPEGWTFISCVHKMIGMRKFHITDIDQAGTVKPGKNFIHIYGLGKRKNPFRLTATIVCEACGRLGWTLIT